MDKYCINCSQAIPDGTKLFCEWFERQVGHYEKEDCPFWLEKIGENEK